MKTSLKQPKILMTLIVLLFLSSHLFAQVKPTDEILSIKKEEADGRLKVVFSMTVKEFDDSFKNFVEMQEYFSGDKVDLKDKSDELKKKFLDNIVNSYLLKEKADREGILSKEDIDSYLSAYRVQIENQLVLDTYLKKEIIPSIKLTDKETNDFYDDIKDKEEFLVKTKAMSISEKMEYVEGLLKNRKAQVKMQSVIQREIGRHIVVYADDEDISEFSSKFGKDWVFLIADMNYKMTRTEFDKVFKGWINFQNFLNPDLSQKIEPSEELEKIFLESFVNNYLIYQKAIKKNIIEKGKFEQHISTYLESLENQLIVNIYQEKHILPSINPNKEDINTFYNQIKDQDQIKEAKQKLSKEEFDKNIEELYKFRIAQEKLQQVIDDEKSSCIIKKNKNISWLN